MECPKEKTLDILKCSGNHACMITAPRAEEEKMGLKVVWTQASSATALLELLGTTEHFGVYGPTRKGQFLVRTSVEHIGAVRKAVLSHMSEYAGVWNVIVQHRYSGRFSDTMSLQSIACSLRESLAWEFVGLSVKKAGKGYVQAVIPAAVPPPTLELAIAGEVVLLHKLGEKQPATLAHTFAHPSTLPAAATNGPVQHKEDEPKPDEPYYATQLQAMENRMEAKLAQFQAKVQQSVTSTLATSVQDLNQKAAANVKEKDARLDSLAAEVKAQAGTSHEATSCHRSSSRCPGQASDHHISTMRDSIRQA